MLGGLPSGVEAQIRDEIISRKRQAASHLAQPPPEQAINADSPIPFDIRDLWFSLDDYERRMYQKDRTTLAALEEEGDPQQLKSNKYPVPGLGSAPPFLGPRRGITRQLDLMRSRLQDARFAFLFSPADDLTPDKEGRVGRDLDAIVASWVGHDRPITILDVSGLPSEVVSAVVGSVLRIVYDTLFWAGDLPVRKDSPNRRRYDELWALLDASLPQL